MADTVDIRTERTQGRDFVDVAPIVQDAALSLTEHYLLLNNRAKCHHTLRTRPAA